MSADSPISPPPADAGSRSRIELSAGPIEYVGTGGDGPALVLLPGLLMLRPLRRLPLSFGWLTTRGDVATARWLQPVLKQAEMRRDAVRVLRGIAADRRVLLEAAESLRDFDRPALVVWASEDRVMSLEHGRRLADLLPRGRLVEIPDSYTLIPLDQPRRLADAIRDFTLA